ncbi:DUF5703 domain-containing protein [Dysgonomonas sp. 511]|uniref:DUF5703 domain-containing protein n=1 Tax=Dysgonomonas sp. 511 TaxID=2302930 RepID=UPI0013D5FCB6|nr:DUF5703 domain-containing protein [Dysgonomonas sp. 511]NDV79734.1 hypothetical protein [Dysgonomonas sp. 511]
MKRIYLYTTLVFLCIGVTLSAQSVAGYNITWDTQSANSSESMPCGGGDIGLNVWTENGDILFYISRSGTFDENNTLLKLGRVRVRLTPNPFEGIFRQTLNLEDGGIYITGKSDNTEVKAHIWVDVSNPVVNVDISNNKALKAEVFYENWRYEDLLLRKSESNQNSYKWAAPKGLSTKKDEVFFDSNKICFYHQNKGETVFDTTVAQQGLESVKGRIFNPLENLIFGGTVEAKGFKTAGISDGNYAGTGFRAWKLESEKPLKSFKIKIRLHTAQNTDIEDWKKAVEKPIASNLKENKKWWTDFWSRSFIHITSQEDDKAWEIARNYQLFRYMLGCNARGDYPTKFNGGLFTYDPYHTDTTFRFTPDFRKWGGGTHTAQNQRLVYFPMLRSGDFDMMKPQFDFYQRILPAAELRSQVYWGHKGACFTEQIENFGLPNPSEYGWKRPESYDKGMEYNAWLEYQWDTALEFCFMILEQERYTGKDISEYLPLIESTLRFFDEHYQYLARERGRKVFDEQGKLVLYPGSACETYKMAYNASSTIAALKVVTSRLLESQSFGADSTKQAYFETFLSRIPDIKTRRIDGHETIAPAWLWERINNTETPQLYPVFPWGIYGIGKDNLEVARNTWKYDLDVVKFRSHIGWKQDAIWAARLGLTDDAKGLVAGKLQSAETRFPVFWGPGFDWTPDHNWGGSGMIALQEMLLQTDGYKLFLLPAWPKEWDVHFKLHAPYNTIVECRYEKGQIQLLKVVPEQRAKDIVIVDAIRSK